MQAIAICGPGPGCGESKHRAPFNLAPAKPVALVYPQMEGESGSTALPLRVRPDVSVVDAGGGSDRRRHSKEEVNESPQKMRRKMAIEGIIQDCDLPLVV